VELRRIKPYLDPVVLEHFLIGGWENKYCDMTPESQNSPLLHNGGNEYACRTQKRPFLDRGFLKHVYVTSRHTVVDELLG
jgi:hypothetical protein